ncbi:MAG TPA: hypothetical protein DDZ42_06545 [Candidatus Rokubacteria bacterium]|nr:hypothetical protein [Candidatus Rokubacteria bacterium]
MTFTEPDPGVGLITMNRPERLNAINPDMLMDFEALFTGLAQDETIRVLILTGAGRGFCSGADLNEAMANRDSEAFADPEHFLRIAQERYAGLILGLRAIPQPVIAAVNGAAAGAGMNLALACDIRLASTTARFAEAFVKRGLHVDWGGTYFLPRVVGMARACELIFTGDAIDAEEALRLGLVSAVHPPERLLPAARELARRIAAGPPLAIRLAKRALYHNQEADLRAALEFETFAQNVCLETEDAREGLRAFVEKRAPVFRGR